MLTGIIWGAFLGRLADKLSAKKSKRHRTIKVPSLQCKSRFWDSGYVFLYAQLGKLALLIRFLIAMPPASEYTYDCFLDRG
jgi:hypothetical protein